MPNTANRDYLLRDQYQNDANLNARIRLHKLFSVNKQGWQDWVFGQMELGPGERLLELGCGPGYLWGENAARLPTGLALVLTDFSAGMLATTRHNLAALPSSAYAVADANAIPFADASFDVVVANHMLYYVADREQTFATIRRILRPGGRFYATTVGLRHMREMRDLLTGFDPALDYDRDFSHGLSFTLENGTDELQRHFSSVALRRFDDALAITAPGPLTDYVMSMLRGQDYRHDALAHYVEREVAAAGSYHITKDSGLFIARP